MFHLSNFQRFWECVLCKYADECVETVSDPEEYDNGRCKTKEEFRKREEIENYE